MKINDIKVLKEGTLSIDVPNEDWLQDKIDYARSKGRNSYGVPFMGSTTAAVRGTPPRVRVLRLASLPGMRNEQTNVRKDDLKWLMDYMDTHKKLPPMGSNPDEEYLPYIMVAYNGEAWVNEGNHRIMAAYRLNWPDMPIEIRYFDGGERVRDGAMYPGKIGLGEVDVPKSKSVTEIFEPGKQNWKWRRQSSDEAFASFVVGDREYQWHAFNSDANTTKWEIQFRLMRVPADPDGLDLFGQTGTGNSAQVLSTAVDITRAFLQAYGLDKVEEITFNAKEDSRIDLYAKMIKRLLPTWELSNRKSQSHGMQFTLTDPRAYDKPENKITEIDRMASNEYSGGKKSLRVGKSQKQIKKLPGNNAFMYSTEENQFETGIIIKLWDSENTSPKPVQMKDEDGEEFAWRLRDWERAQDEDVPGALVGKLVLEDAENFPLKGALQVDTITVDEDYRGQGIAKSMYGVVLSILKKPLIAGSGQTQGGRRNWLSLASTPGVEIKGYVIINQARFDNPEWADKDIDVIMGQLGGQYIGPSKPAGVHYFAFDVVPGSGELAPAVKTELSKIYDGHGAETGLYAVWHGAVSEDLTEAESTGWTALEVVESILGKGRVTADEDELVQGMYYVYESNSSPAFEDTEELGQTGGAIRLHDLEATDPQAIAEAAHEACHAYAHSKSTSGVLYTNEKIINNLAEIWLKKNLSGANLHFALEHILGSKLHYGPDHMPRSMAEGSLEELANTSLKVKEPKDFVNVNDRKQVTYKVMKFKSGKDTYLINFTVKGAPAYGKKSNWNAVNVAFGVREEQDDYSFGDEINTDLTARNKNQFLIYSTVINAVRKFITEYNTEIDEIIMQGAGERQAVMYQRFFQSAGKYFPGWHYDGKHSLVRDVPRQQAKKVREQGVAEGEVVPLGKKHRGDLDSINSCSKCGGKLEGGHDVVSDLEQDLENPHSYDAIDHMMQTIARDHGITAKQLHDLFVDKHGQVPDEWVNELAENFADGKNPQDKGDSQRHGIPKGATMAELEKAAKAPGRKGQLARWQLNMRRGRKKATEGVVNEGGWASTETQNTTITPRTVAEIVHILDGFEASYNAWQAANELDAEIKIGRPKGSGTYYRRDLEQDPDREYGDVDVECFVHSRKGSGSAQRVTEYRRAIKDYCAQSPDFSTDNGTNVIMRTTAGPAQVDLIYTFHEHADWSRVLSPEYRVKGVISTSLTSSIAEALNLSFSSQGIQVKIRNNQPVSFRQSKDTELRTVSINPDNWAQDVYSLYYYLSHGEKPAEMPRDLQAHGGLKDEQRLSDIVLSIKALASGLEEANLLAHGALIDIHDKKDLIRRVAQIYSAKLEAAENSSKFDKASTPVAVEKAKKTKLMLAKYRNEVTKLLLN